MVVYNVWHDTVANPFKGVLVEYLMQRLWDVYQITAERSGPYCFLMEETIKGGGLRVRQAGVLDEYVKGISQLLCQSVLSYNRIASCRI